LRVTVPAEVPPLCMDDGMRFIKLTAGGTIDIVTPIDDVPCDAVTVTFVSTETPWLTI